jgi:hypothetical protein
VALGPWRKWKIQHIETRLQLEILSDHSPLESDPIGELFFGDPTRV